LDKIVEIERFHKTLKDLNKKEIVSPVVNIQSFQDWKDINLDL